MFKLPKEAFALKVTEMVGLPGQESGCSDLEFVVHFLVSGQIRGQHLYAANSHCLQILF